MAKREVLTDKQIMRALRRLERGWPDDLALFAWNGTLCLMDENLRHERTWSDAIIDEYRIACDGGDPDGDALYGESFSKTDYLKER